MLTLIKENHAYKAASHKRKKEVWENITTGMSLKGYHITWDAIAKKWANMLDTYKKICDRSNKTGTESITWPWYDIIDEMLGDQPNIRPMVGSCIDSCRIRSPVRSPNTSNATSSDTQVPSTSSESGSSTSPKDGMSNKRSENEPKGRSTKRRQRLDTRSRTKPLDWFADYTTRKEAADKEFREQIINIMAEKK